MTSVIEFGNWTYHHNSREKYTYSNDGVRITFKGFNDIKIIKSREGFLCRCCGKDCKPRTRCIGHYWDRVCHNCLSEWLDKSKITFQNFIEMFGRIKQEVEENKSQWDTEVVVGAI